jgi:hypothetical protein
MRREERKVTSSSHGGIRIPKRKEIDQLTMKREPNKRKHREPTGAVENGKERGHHHYATSKCKR